MIHLIFVQMIGRVFLGALALKRDDDEADKDIQHEKAHDDDVSHKEGGHVGTVVEDGPVVLGVGVDAGVGVTERNFLSKKIPFITQERQSWEYPLKPALRSGYREHGDQGFADVVKVEIAADPLADSEFADGFAVSIHDEISSEKKKFTKISYKLNK